MWFFTFIYPIALTVGSVLFLFHMLYRVVRVLERFVGAYEAKNNKKENN